MQPHIFKHLQPGMAKEALDRISTDTCLEPPDKEQRDRENTRFWRTICGSSLAHRLGATDNSPRSLCVFDTYYLSYYSYLYDWLPVQGLAGKDVLEVGLGFGTVGQLLSSARANYTGLDIAAEPVGLMNLRLQSLGLPGHAVEGSILDAPFPERSFDYVVAIGSLHHTGDVERAIAEVSRVLRPGGRLIMMVYYAYSYRMWIKRKLRLFKDLLLDVGGVSSYTGDPDERAMYDTNLQGQPAPNTVFLSKRQLRRIARRSGLRVERASPQNAHVSLPLRLLGFTRDRALKTWARYIGTDLYAVLKKR
ncbi:MAG: class I SAM-dependent methyltransferase [Pirellulales bacterium]